MDVKAPFLNGDLDEEIYMEQPEGFIVKGQERKVCKLAKSLYGLKQAPKQWHEKFDKVISEYDFEINEHEKCVYYKEMDNVLFYVFTSMIYYYLELVWKLWKMLSLIYQRDLTWKI